MSSQLSALADSSVAPNDASIVSLASTNVIARACTRRPSTRSASKGKEKAVVSSCAVSGDETKTSVRFVVPSGAMKKLTCASSSISSCTWRLLLFRNSITSTVATKRGAATTVSFCAPALGLTSNKPLARRPKRGKVEKKVRSTSPISCSHVMNCAVA